MTANLSIFADMNIRAFTLASCMALVALTGMAQSRQDKGGSASEASSVASSEMVATDGREKVENDFLTIVTNFTAGDYDLAGRQLRGWVRQHPDDDAAWFYLGKADLYLSRTQEAVESFRKAYSMDSTNFWYGDQLAVTYAVTGQEELAADIYGTLLRRFPDKTDVYYDLVNIHLRMGRLEEALEDLDNIERVMGKNEQISNMRYQILMHQDKPEEAFQALEDYNDDFSSPSVLTAMGDHKMSQYEDSVALGYYEEALGLSSDYVPAILGKAEVYRQRRDYADYFSTIGGFIRDPNQEAASKSQYLNALFRQSDAAFIRNFTPQIDSLVEGAKAVHPADSTVLATAGIWYYNTDRVEEAMENFAQNKDFHPGSKGARLTYIQSIAMGGDWEKVVEEADLAEVDFPDDLDFPQLKVSALYQLGRIEELIRTEERIIAKADGDSLTTVTAWSTIGDSYHILGDGKKAYKAYEEALKISPRHLPTLNNYAYYLSMDGKSLKKACDMSKVTVDGEPDNPTYLDTYGWILHLLGKSQEAKAVFKHAMLYGGKDNATILDHYAEVLYALKEYDLARVYWTQAQAKDTDGEIPDLEERIKARLDSLK